MRWLRFGVGLLLLGGLVAFLAAGPTPGPVLRNNVEQEIEATALFYMDLDAMQDLERRLEALRENKEEEDGSCRAGGASPSARSWPVARFAVPLRLFLAARPVSPTDVTRGKRHLPGGPPGPETTPV